MFMPTDTSHPIPHYSLPLVVSLELVAAVDRLARKRLSFWTSQALVLHLEFLPLPCPLGPQEDLPRTWSSECLPGNLIPPQAQPGVTQVTGFWDLRPSVNEYPSPRTSTTCAA